MASASHKTAGPGAQPPVVSANIPGFENMKPASSVKGPNLKASSEGIGRELLNKEIGESVDD